MWGAIHVRPQAIKPQSHEVSVAWEFSHMILQSHETSGIYDLIQKTSVKWDLSNTISQSHEISVTWYLRPHVTENSCRRGLTLPRSHIKWGLTWLRSHITSGLTWLRYHMTEVSHYMRSHTAEASHVWGLTLHEVSHGWGLTWLRSHHMTEVSLGGVLGGDLPRRPWRCTRGTPGRAGTPGLTGSGRRLTAAPPGCHAPCGSTGQCCRVRGHRSAQGSAG